MSVENLNVIDFVSIDLNGNAVLTISDHFEWDDKNEHLLLLQNKINSYLESIEGGDLYKKYPNAKDRKIVINIVAKYPPNNTGEVFLNSVKGVLEASGYSLQFKVLDS